MDKQTIKSVFTRIKNIWLDANAALEFGVYDGLRVVKDSYANYSNMLERLHVTGFKKFIVHVTSEGFTLGTGAAMLALVLAVPAFNAVQDENWLKKTDLAVSFMDRYGNDIGKRGIRHDDSIKVNDLPDHLVKALLATEDRRFFDHFGIDFIGTLRALTVNARAGGVSQGGSTLTQQLAKNLFLTSERSIDRKIKEAYLAFWLETRLTKQEILKLYLDRAYMGAGNFGVQAASEFYFGHNVQDLTLSESAMLAGLFKAPTKYAPHVNLPAARARANDVLTNMVDAGFLTEGQVVTARRNPATPVDRVRGQDAGYFLDYAFDEVKKLSDEGKFGSDRVLNVKTTLDLDLQKKTDESMEAVLREYGDVKNVSQGAAVLMEPDGAVRAIFGGRDYGSSQFNRATNALRQPGSSFKPYVYAAALMSGKYTPMTTVIDSPVCIGRWCPSNYAHSYAGSVPLWNSLARSINSIPIKLTTDIGHGNAKAGRIQVIDVVKKMGAATELRNDVTMPIGTVEMTVMGQATGYSAFANGGQRIGAHAATEVRNSAGETIYRFDTDGPKPVQVLSSKVVSDMNFMLNKVVEEGTAKRQGYMPNIRAAGKTGTTDSYKDAWFVGYTGNYVAAVWFGNDDTSPTAEVTGGFLPTMAWKGIMEYAHKNAELKPIPGLLPNDAVVAQNTIAAVPKKQTGAAAGFSPVELSTTQRGQTLTPKAVTTISEIGSLFRLNSASHLSEGKSLSPVLQPVTTLRKPVQRADGGKIMPISGL
jgi:penicillin-binding protein 1A